MKRQVIAGVLTIGLGWGAHAADPRTVVPIELIPETPTYWSWSGIYVGGQWGYSSADFDPRSATGSLVARILRDTTIEEEANISQLPQLPKSGANTTSYGGFVGFNQQWEDVIVGLELNYNIARLSANSADSISRAYTASDGYRYNVTLDSQASVALKDYGTLRARAGYVLDRLLPYAQVGAALGRADVSRSVAVNLAATDVTNIPPLPDVGLVASENENKRNAMIFGVTAGVGLDVAITPNIFLRAEYEFVHFLPFKGMTLDIHTGRVGAALKF